MNPKMILMMHGNKPNTSLKERRTPAVYQFICGNDVCTHLNSMAITKPLEEYNGGKTYCSYCIQEHIIISSAEHIITRPVK